MLEDIEKEDIGSEIVHETNENMESSTAQEVAREGLDDSIDKAAKVLAGIEDEKDLSETTVSKASRLKRVMQKLAGHISNPLGK